MVYDILYARQEAPGSRNVLLESAVMRGINRIDGSGAGGITVHTAQSEADILKIVNSGKIDLVIVDMPKKGKDFARVVITEAKIKNRAVPAIVVSDIAECHINEALKGLTWETVRKDRDPKPIVDAIRKHMARKIEMGLLPAGRGTMRKPQADANPPGVRGSGPMKPIKQ